MTLIDFDESELNIARARIGEGLHKTGFDVIRSYIFGDYWAEKMNLPKFGVPAYGGYAWCKPICNAQATL